MSLLTLLPPSDLRHWHVSAKSNELWSTGSAITELYCEVKSIKISYIEATVGLCHYRTIQIMKPYTELPYIFSESVSRVSVFLSVHIPSPWLVFLWEALLCIYHGNQITLFLCWLMIIATRQAAALLPLWTPPPPFSYRSKTTPPSVLSAELFCSCATASIIHSHLFCVQLLDLLMGRKPGLNWSTAFFFFFMSTSSLLSVGKRVITWLHVPASIQPGSFKAHNLHPRCSEKDVILQDLLVSQ